MREKEKKKRKRDEEKEEIISYITEEGKKRKTETWISIYSERNHFNSEYA